MKSTGKIKVMVVEDSVVIRELLAYIIAQDPRLELAACMGSGEAALEALKTLTPDVISMDIRLPGLNGFETTRRIMAQKPTPIVVVSASVEAEELKISLNALRAGALSVLEKPVGTTHADYQAMAERLCTQLAIMSQVKVIRQRIMPTGPAHPHPPVPRPPGSGLFQMLGIAASTGGPNALVNLLSGLGSDFPLPILLVQHITPSFLAGFATWLSSVTPFVVCIAQEGEIPQPGGIYLPPADRHLVLRQGKLYAQDSPPVSNQRPSGTVLFQSMALELGPAGLGLILTGMGDDGAEGLLAMRKQGALTLAEDESTAVIYGMPQAAMQLGAASEQWPLGVLAPRLLELVAKP